MSPFVNVVLMEELGADSSFSMMWNANVIIHGFLNETSFQAVHLREFPNRNALPNLLFSMVTKIMRIYTQQAIPLILLTYSNKI